MSILGEPSIADGAAAPDWDTLAGGARLSGELEPGGAHLTLMLDLDAVPHSLAGRRLRLCLGEAVLMDVPLRHTGGPAQFGPLRLTLAEALRGFAAPPRLSVAGLPPRAPGRIEGPALEALSIATEAAFFEKVQLNHSRFQDPALLRLGAQAAYRRLPGFAPRAAALTVLAHRVLERDLGRLSAGDHAEAGWLRGEGRRVVEEGLALLAAAKDRPYWTVVRWTTSLASVCALLSLCQDDAPAARFFFGAAAAQAHLVQVAPVAAANLAHACLLHGVMLGLADEREAARAVLERGVRLFQTAAAAQDMMANVWVIGDMINVGRAARMCFVALARFGLLEQGATPRIHPGTRLDLRQVAAPVMKILAAGLCPGLAAQLAALEPAAP